MLYVWLIDTNNSHNFNIVIENICINPINAYKIHDALFLLLLFNEQDYENITSSKNNDFNLIVSILLQTTKSELIDRILKFLDANVFKWSYPFKYRSIIRKNDKLILLNEYYEKYSN